MLTEVALLVSDGGGRKPAVRLPSRERDRIRALFSGTLAKQGWSPGPGGVRLVTRNGVAGLVITKADGHHQIWSLNWTAVGRIRANDLARNPDALPYLELAIGSVMRPTAGENAPAPASEPSP